MNAAELRLRKLPTKLPPTHLAGVRLDDEDLDLTAAWSWCITSNGYVRGTRTIAPKKRIDCYLHRLILGFPALPVDHINGNKLDNRRSNLRVVPQTINQINRHVLASTNRSGATGVALTNQSSRNPWRAEIKANKRRYHLGLFPTFEAALKARREAELRLWGHYAPWT